MDEVLIDVFPRGRDGRVAQAFHRGGVGPGGMLCGLLAPVTFAHRATERLYDHGGESEPVPDEPVG